mmetsp:Transcript_98614/g.283445  ORF Transcript_98614/g.283445 Transcript_98614/m.283445 type:complete len:323 (+) Transcript_98614:338-1306(+)
MRLLHVVSDEHQDGNDPARQGREGRTKKIHRVSEEGHEVREQPSGNQTRYYHSVPSGERSLPRVFWVRPLLLGKGEHGPAQDDALDQIGNQHVDDQATSCHLEGHVKGQVLVEHAIDTVAQEVIPSQAREHECGELERRRNRHICLRKLGWILHLRYDLRQHELRGHTESERAQARQHSRGRHRGDRHDLRVLRPDAVDANDDVVTHWDEDCTAQGHNVDPHQRLVRAHLPRGASKGQQNGARDGGPHRQADPLLVEEHAQALAGTQQIDAHQPEQKRILGHSCQEQQETSLQLWCLLEGSATQGGVGAGRFARLIVHAHAP